MFQLAKIGFGNITPDTWIVTLAGFLIVFIVLMILIIIFTIFGKVMEKVNKREKAQAVKAPENKASVSQSSSGVTPEVAAVITAAITEASGGKSFIIKDIKEAGK